MYLVRLGIQNHSGTAFRLHRVVGGASASIIMKLEHHIPVAGVCTGRGPYGGPASDSAAFTCRLRGSYPFLLSDACCHAPPHERLAEFQRELTQVLAD